MYGAPRHEYFYDKFNYEYFHEFCAPDTAVNMEALMKLKSEAPELDIMSLWSLIQRRKLFLGFKHSSLFFFS